MAHPNTKVNPEHGSTDKGFSSLTEQNELNKDMQGFMILFSTDTWLNLEVPTSMSVSFAVALCLALKVMYANLQTTSMSVLFPSW